MAAKRKTRVGVDDVLPLEIWTEILTRVEVKTMLRCRSVCKSWYSLVSSPNFISDYSTKNLNKSGCRVLLGSKPGHPDGWLYSSHDESFMESRQHDDVPKVFRGSYLHIVGSCNGLICCTTGSSTEFFIWNPTIGKIVELPSRPYHSLTERLSYCGFGFDSNTNDYKVLRVLCNKIDNGYIFDGECEIFDLSRGDWRVSCPRPPSSWFVGGCHVQECYLDGAAYWSDHRVLLSFNFSDECFGEIRMPKFVDSVQEYDPNWSYTRIRCMELSGFIYVMRWTRENCSIWKMKEYGVTESWTKVFTIDPQGLPDFHTNRNSILSFFCLWKNGEVLMVHNHRNLVSYNPDNRKFQILFSSHISSTSLYEESMVLM